MTKRFRLILSGALALLTVGFCALYAQEVRAEANRERSEVLERYGGEVVRLVVAPDGLEAGDTVSAQNAELREWVGTLAPKEALVSMDDAVGRRVTVPAAAGAPLTELNFRDEGEVPEVPSGYMALQVPLGEKLGLSASVGAGTRLVAYEVGDAGTRLLSGDVQVLAASASGGASLSRGSICVAVRPGDVASLLSSSTAGTLRLVIPSEDVRADQVATAPSSVEAAGDESEGAEASDVDDAPSDVGASREGEGR